MAAAVISEASGRPLAAARVRANGRRLYKTTDGGDGVIFHGSALGIEA
jgi:hypothetical protein